MWTAILLGAGAVMTVASMWIGLEQWGPLFLLWTGGGTHLALIVRRGGTGGGPPRAAASRLRAGVTASRP